MKDKNKRWQDRLGNKGKRRPGARIREIKGSGFLTPKELDELEDRLKKAVQEAKRQGWTLYALDGVNVPSPGTIDQIIGELYRAQLPPYDPGDEPKGSARVSIIEATPKWSVGFLGSVWCDVCVNDTVARVAFYLPDRFVIEWIEPKVQNGELR